MNEQVPSSQVMDKIDLVQLLPEWSAILHGFPETGVGLSAWFVGSLITLTVLFLLFSLYKAGQAGSRIRWLNRLLHKLKAEDMAGKREELRDEARKAGSDAGHLWLEFDETLVVSACGGKLHNTYDAAWFFNSSSLASGITESRLIAAVPGFLTALGVIGTFVGLQLGLSQLHIASDVSVEEMKSGIAGVINGAKFAFMTSVWGVALSVAFNLMEKILERTVRQAIVKLQDRIDHLFPRINAEEQLQRIAVDGRESRETLQGLAEQIGHKMQESLLGATNAIQDGLKASLNEALAPAIDKLVDTTSDGNQQALQTLLEQFMDKFGAEGSRQRDSIDQASEKMNASLTAFGSAVQVFISKMEASQQDTAQREQALVQKISGQVDYLVESTSTQNKTLTEFVESTLGNLASNLSERDATLAEREQVRGEALANQTAAMNQAMSAFTEKAMGQLTHELSERDKATAEQDKRRSEEFMSQIEAMRQSTEQLLQAVETGLKAQFGAVDKILSQSEALQKSVDVSVRASTQASDSMKASASELNTAGSHFRDAGDRLSVAVVGAVNSTAALADKNRVISQELHRLREQVVQDTERFGVVTEKLQAVVLQADSTFSHMADHQRAYLEGLKQNLNELTGQMNAHINALSGQMTSLLHDYAEKANAQTENHLKIWAEGTTNYTTEMNNAVRALSGVVDEIEVKLGR